MAFQWLSSTSRHPTRRLSIIRSNGHALVVVPPFVTAVLPPLYQSALWLASNNNNNGQSRQFNNDTDDGTDDCIKESAVSEDEEDAIAITIASSTSDNQSQKSSQNTSNRSSSTPLHSTPPPSRRRQGEQQQPQHRLSLPVLGPLLLNAVAGGSGGAIASSSSRRSTSLPLHQQVHTGPLLPAGQSLLLIDPTPMQWQTLQQCLSQHARHMEHTTATTTTTSYSTSDTNTNHHDDEEADAILPVAGVTAAPLVALLDESTTTVSSTSWDRQSRQRRYATIAAIVGLSTTTTGMTTIDIKTADLLRSDSSESSSGGSSSSTSKPRNKVDISGDNGDFMESLLSSTDSSASTGLVKVVRLMGIGRAAVTDLFYQSAKEDCIDEEGNLLDVPECPWLDSDDMDEDASWHDCDTTDNILMAHFVMIHDTGPRQSGPSSSSLLLRRTNHFSADASPVHALAQWSQLAAQLHRYHTQRQQLVAGLRAATVRLRTAAASKLKDGYDNEDEDDALYDHDGLGSLFASHDTSIGEDASADYETDDNTNSVVATPPLEPSNAAEVSWSIDNNNYGLGETSSSFSNLAALTAQHLALLQPYYSPEWHNSEEHYYYVYSMCAMAAVAEAVIPIDRPHRTAWAVMCRNTLDRFTDVVDHMQEHVRLLRQHADAMNQQLLECGEECTDLW